MTNSTQNKNPPAELEERYIVVKINKLHPHPHFRKNEIASLKSGLTGEALVDCIVCERDWPMYQQVEDLILGNDQARSDNQFYMAQLQLRACKALGLDPDSCSWFDVVGKLESTPSSRWKATGEPDPHAGHYDGERATLALGHLTDDELANAAFMGYDGVLDINRILAKDPNYHSPIALMTAVKDRIRWLSRKLEATKESV